MLGRSLEYGTGVDVWACACLAVELRTGTPLFSGEDDNQLVSAVNDSNPSWIVTALRPVPGSRQTSTIVTTMTTMDRLHRRFAFLCPNAISATPTTVGATIFTNALRMENYAPRTNGSQKQLLASKYLAILFRT